MSTETPSADVVTKASGSSFYAAMRILPQVQRDAMYEIYSFCRQVDDIADSDLPRPERFERLAAWRKKIAALDSATPPAGLASLARTKKAFSLAREDFLAVIEGMEMDAREDIRAPDYATLDLYCDRVASAVGRLSVRVFGTPEEDGKLLAHHLGRALQLTNILRDLDEDAGFGRLYLPREALAEAGIEAATPEAVLASPRLGKACAFVAERALAHYREAETVMARAPRKTVRAPRVMGKVYRSILEGMMAQGWAAPRPRVRPSRLKLLGILLRYAIV